MTFNNIGPSPDARRVFDALRRSKNVLITGAPSTGKTHLLSHMARWFEEDPGVEFDPEDVPFLPAGASEWLPSPGRRLRKSFKMVFHPGTRHRHLLRGMEPTPEVSGAFRYSKGMLYLANEHALKKDGAALLIIDEINRGPAVESFGDTIVPLEADKRLGKDDQRRTESFPIQLPNEAGELKDYYFSDHLYLLAAMNAADASVAPMDVAFLRRWAPVRIFPDPSVARVALGLSSNPSEDGDSQRLLRALVNAWEQVNRRISRLRGSEYEIGHGVLIPEAGRDVTDFQSATSLVQERWSQIEQHVGELFFGDLRGEVAALGGYAEGIYRLEEGYIRTELTTEVIRPTPETSEEWITTLQAIAKSDA